MMKKILLLALGICIGISSHAQESARFFAEINLLEFAEGSNINKVRKAIPVLSDNGIEHLIISGTEGRDKEGKIITYLKPSQDLGTINDLRKLFSSLEAKGINYYVDAQIGDYSSENLLVKNKGGYFTPNEDGGFSLKMDHGPALKSLRRDMRNLAVNWNPKGLRISLKQTAKPKQINSIIETINYINKEMKRAGTVFISGEGNDKMQGTNYSIDRINSLPEDFIASTPLNKAKSLLNDGVPLIQVTESSLNENEGWKEVKEIVKLVNANDVFTSADKNRVSATLKGGVQLQIVECNGDAVLLVYNSTPKKLKVKYKIEQETLKGAYKSVFESGPNFIAGKKIKFSLLPGELAFAQKLN